MKKSSVGVHDVSALCVCVCVKEGETQREKRGGWKGLGEKKSEMKAARRKSDCECDLEL